MWQISRIIGMAFLIGMSVEDVLFKKISNQLLVMLGILSVIYQILCEENMWLSGLGGIAIGCFFLVFSYATREALGYGDSWLICILGVFVGGMVLLEMLVVAWAAVSIGAMVILVRKRFSRKASIPFVPFIALGYGLVSLGGVL